MTCSNPVGSWLSSLAYFIGAAALLAPSPGAAAPLELRTGDRVVLLGSTVIEREQSESYWETALTARYPDQTIAFRNLGWSGDTVFADARAGFGSAADGFRELAQQISELKPTVVLVAFGANESFDGLAGLDRFKEGLNTLLDMLASSSATDPRARMVLLTPTPQENLGPPFPDASAHNVDLALYRDAIQAIGQERGHSVVDLLEAFTSIRARTADEPLTDNGLHYTPHGYWRTAPIFEEALCGPAETWYLDLDTSGQVATQSGLTLEGLQATRDDVHFRATATRLPMCAAPPNDAPVSSASVSSASLSSATFTDAEARRSPRLRVRGLAKGDYVLNVNEKPLLRATAQQWAEGVRIVTGPDQDQVEALRQAIRLKNELYFHRWRPQNVTYLFGFRKHEQGNNAAEVAQFEPLVAEQERHIAELRVPLEQRFEITKVKDGAGE